MVVIPRDRVCQNTIPARHRPPKSSFLRKLVLDPDRGRESKRGGAGKRRHGTPPPPLDSRFPGRVKLPPLPLGEGWGEGHTHGQAAIDPLSLWERVGVREPRGKQAGVNGNEWERQGYWGPSPGLRPPSPKGRGVGFGTGRTGLRPPSPKGRGVLTQPVSRE